jgi:hypothetical protein
MVITDDIPIQASHICNESNYSTPITSPYQPTTMGECDQPSTYSSMGTNPASLCVSPDMILDSSKVSNWNFLVDNEFVFLKLKPKNA